jgi:hypothetical protein
VLPRHPRAQIGEPGVEQRPLVGGERGEGAVDEIHDVRLAGARQVVGREDQRGDGVEVAASVAAMVPTNWRRKRVRCRGPLLGRLTSQRLII